MKQEDVAVIRVTYGESQTLKKQRKKKNRRGSGSFSSFSAATVAIYRGMAVHELQVVLKSAFGLAEDIDCCALRGVTATNKQHILPLSTVCAEPELAQCLEPASLQLLVADKSAFGLVQVHHEQSSRHCCNSALGGTRVCGRFDCRRKDADPCTFTTAATASAQSAASVSGSASTPVEKIIASLVEDREISHFESIVLLELCVQQRDKVNNMLKNAQLGAQKKKDFFLELLHRPAKAPTPASPTSPTSPSICTSQSQSPNAITTTSPRGGARNVTFALDTDVVATMASSEARLSFSKDVGVFKKALAIAHMVFSPQVQSDIMKEASMYRKRFLQNHVVMTPDAPVLMELLGIVEKMLNKHLLKEEHGLYLVQLILNSNQVVLNALQTYKKDLNLQELEFTLLQIASVGCGSKAVTEELSPPKPGVAPGTDAPGSPSKIMRKRVAKERQGFIVRPQDILHTLFQKEMLTHDQFNELRALVSQNDPLVQHAVAEYEQTRDLHFLSNTLVSIAEHRGAHGVNGTCAGGVSTANAASAAAEELWWGEPLQHFIAKWTHAKVLSEEELQVLNGLLAQRHNLLESAFEVFATDGDAMELLDTILRIVRLQMKQQQIATGSTVAQSNQQPVDVAALLPKFCRLVDAHCDEALEPNEKDLVKQMFARGNELVVAAWEVYNVEHNAEDFCDTLLRIVRFASRKASKGKLVSVIGEMLRCELLKSHEADGLIRLYEEHNDAILAANEAFESDGDVRELMDTLQLIVKHANFGSPPRCTSSKVAKTIARVSSPLHKRTSISSDDQMAACKMIEVLGDVGGLSSWQVDLLLEGITQEDQRVFAAMDVYAWDQNKRELIDTLWHLCDIIAWENCSHLFVTKWIEPLERQGNVFLLKQLVKQRDPRILGAYVVYLDDQNAEEFLDSLLRIDRVTIRNLLPRFKQVVEELGNQKQWEPLQTQFLTQLLEEGDAQVLEVCLMFKENRDEEDFVDSLKRIYKLRLAHAAAVEDDEDADHEMTSPPPSPQQMSKQLLHFIHEMKLSAKEVDALKQAIMTNHPMLQAALEVYHMDKDEEDLKDTLLRFAHHATHSSQ